MCTRHYILSGNSDLTTLDGRLDSIETTTSSLDGRVDSLETTSGSHDGRLDSLESNSGSYLTEYNDEYTTGATFNSGNGVITYTRNDGDTFTVDIDGRYLTSFTETDPVFTASPSAGITQINITNWDSSYNYSQVGHLPLSGGTITGHIIPSVDNTQDLGSTNSKDFRTLYVRNIEMFNQRVNISSTGTLATITDHTTVGDGIQFSHLGTEILRLGNGSSTTSTFAGTIVASGYNDGNCC